MHRLKSVVLEVWLPIVLVAGWLALSAGSTSLFFPPLGQILREFKAAWLFGHFVSDALPSLRNLLAGYAIACVLGIAGGLVLGLMPVLRQAVAPVVEFLRAIPGVAILPVALLVLGTGPTMKISIIAFGAVWPVLLNTTDGVRSLDVVLQDMSASYRIRGFDSILRLRLPNAAAQILAGMRTALSISIVLVVVSEMVAATNGIGFFVLQAQRRFEITQMWTGMMLMGIVGYLSSLLFRLTERRLLRWRHQRNNQIGGG